MMFPLQNRNRYSIVCQQYANRKDRIKTCLKIFKRKSIFGNQLHKLKIPLKWLWLCQYNSDLDKTTTKRSEFSRSFWKHGDQRNMKQIKKHSMHLSLGLWWELVVEERETNKSFDKVERERESTLNYVLIHVWDPSYMHLLPRCTMTIWESMSVISTMSHSYHRGRLQIKSFVYKICWHYDIEVVILHLKTL